MIEVSKQTVNELLEKNKGSWLLTEEIISQEEYNFHNQCIIVPCNMVDSRKYNTKINKLISYRMIQARQAENRYIISCDDISHIDKRIRLCIDKKH